MKIRAKSKPWSVKEEQFLINNFYIIGAKKCSEKLNRDLSTVHARVIYMIDYYGIEFKDKK